MAHSTPKLKAKESIFGSDSNLANNFKLHKSGSKTVQIVVGTDTTSDGSLSTNALTLFGTVPVGTILPFLGGYFTDANNAAFASDLGALSTWLDTNTEGSWRVCDGSAPNDSQSPIYNSPTRHLPNLTDDRFLQGSINVGLTGGINSAAHTHTSTSNVTIADHSALTLNAHTVTQPTFSVPAHYHGKGNLAIADNHQHFTTLRADSGAQVAFGLGGNYQGIVGSDVSTGTLSYSSTTSLGSVTISGSYVGYNSGSNGDASFTASRTTDVALSNHTFSQNITPHAVTNNQVTTSTSSLTENRPQYLNLVYICRIK